MNTQKLQSHCIATRLQATTLKKCCLQFKITVLTHTSGLVPWFNLCSTLNEPQDETVLGCRYCQPACLTWSISQRKAYYEAAGNQIVQSSIARPGSEVACVALISQNLGTWTWICSCIGAARSLAKRRQRLTYNNFFSAAASSEFLDCRCDSTSPIRKIFEAKVDSRALMIMWRVNALFKASTTGMVSCDKFSA